MALSFVIAAITLALTSTTYADKLTKEISGKVRGIVTSDTLLSGMIASLMPPNRYSIEAMLPPVLCPGHYDMKLSDIEKMKKADLNVSFRGMAFMNKAGAADGAHFIVVDGGRNWMAPDAYIYGLGVLADRLSKHFPEDADTIMSRKQSVMREVQTAANLLIERIKKTDIFGKPIIASSMQKEPLEWMGFRVVGEYGRPEAMSAREFVRLAKIGKEQHAIMVVDNLQSGPEAGKGIAETLGTPHVVLMNFPSEKGYLATIGDNVDAVLAALNKK
jgi:ABC-type Zn uptake system ZnuABC Zn-binding protein ZnuA